MRNSDLRYLFTLVKDFYCVIPSHIYPAGSVYIKAVKVRCCIATDDERKGNDHQDERLSYSHDVTLSDGWVVTDLDVDKKDFSMAKATVRVRARNAADKPVKTTLAATIAPGGYSVKTDVELAAGETREAKLAAR